MVKNMRTIPLILPLLVVFLLLLTVLFTEVKGTHSDNEVDNEQVPPWLPWRASIEALNVSVNIDHSFTTTVIEQELFNPFARPISDTFMFKVPEDAFITNFSVEVDGHTHYAELMTKGEAEGSFNDAVAKGHSAGLLLSRDTTKFPYSLNFGPGQRIKCRLIYEEFTQLYLHRYKYNLYLHGINGHRVVPLVEVDINIHAGAPLVAINATGNFVDPEIVWNSPEKCNIRLFQYNTTEVSNLLFRFQTEDIPFGGRFLASEREDEGYFLHLFSPTKESLGGTSINKNIIFVLDKSGSMIGNKMTQLKEAFSDIISSLDPGDRFNIIMFDSDIKPYSDGLVPATGSNLTDAVEYVNRIDAAGCTNLYDGMKLALDQLSDPIHEETAGMPIILMLTDGLANRGKYTSSSEIRANIGEHNEFGASIYCLGFGDDVDHSLLSSLALDNNGKSRKIFEGNDAVEQLWEFYSQISTPLLRDISFSYTGGAHEVYPEGVDCLYDGSEVIIAGKFSASQDSVTSTVEGAYYKGQFATESTFDIPDEGLRDIVPRFWAYKKILSLMERIDSQEETSYLVDMVVELSLEFGFLTKYTGFFVDVGSFSEGTGEWDAEGANQGGQQGQQGSQGQGQGQGQGSDPVNPDTDGDGFSDGEELQDDLDNDGISGGGSGDSDGNGISDNQEPGNPYADSDGDGLSNSEEILLGTDPGNQDTDGDGFLDGWESEGGSDPFNSDDPSPAGDFDHDDLTNVLELELGTDPYDPDTDDDGLTDGREVVLACDPLDRDTDNDGLSDGFEMDQDLDPTCWDSDNDTYSDYFELGYGTDPTDPLSIPIPPDLDCDGLDDWTERDLGTHPGNPDTDGDGFLDGDEVELDYDPLSPDSHPSYTDMDCNGILDVEEPKNPNADSDGDGVLNGQEEQYRTDPLDPDSYPGTTGGYADTDEPDINNYISNSLSLDSDGDGFCDAFDSLPLDPEAWMDMAMLLDLDGDGIVDGLDAFPENPSEWDDTDGDGYGDNSDAFPKDAGEWNDADGDGYGDNCDAFPEIADEWCDTDSDGYGDNGDMFPDDHCEWNDTDHDGYGDNRDMFPLNDSEWNDADGDGYGDNGDGFPLNPYEWLDSDSDGTGDNSDGFPDDPKEWTDEDLDGYGDNADDFPRDPAASLDSDRDGYPDRWNKGLTQMDSVGGLVIDAYPDDPSRWSNDDMHGMLAFQDLEETGTERDDISGPDSGNQPVHEEPAWIAPLVSVMAIVAGIAITITLMRKYREVKDLIKVENEWFEKKKDKRRRTSQ